MNGLELSKKIAKALDDKKGQNIKIIKIEDLTSVTDYIVVANGNSTTQVKALADEVEYQLKTDLSIQPTNMEGFDSKQWILLDYDTVIVHVFHPEARDYYNLEKLWADGQEVETGL